MKKFALILSIALASLASLRAETPANSFWADGYLLYNFDICSKAYEAKPFIGGKYARFENRVLTVSESEGDNPKEANIYEYWFDEKGALAFLFEPKYVYKFEYLKDDEGRIVERRDYIIPGKALDKVVKYYYDGEGRPIESREIRKGEFEYKYEYEDGRISAIVETRENENGDEERYKYYFDAEGKIIEVRKASAGFLGAFSKWEPLFAYTYDKRGRAIKRMNLKNPDMNAIYRYDDRNEARKTVYANGEVFLSSFTITPYKTDKSGITAASGEESEK